MMNFRIWINGSEVSDSVIREDLPEYLETSVRGPGFFEFRVEPFRFRVLSEVAPEIGQSCRVDIDGETWLDGVIDSIADAYTDTPEVEAVPFGAALKDVPAGVLGTAPDGRQRRELEFDPAVPLATAMETLINGSGGAGGYNLNKPSHFPEADWTINIVGTGSDFITSAAPYGLTYNRTFDRDHIQSPDPGEFTAQGLPTPSTDELIEVRRHNSGNRCILGVRMPYYHLFWQPVIRRFYFHDDGPPDENYVEAGGEWLTVAEFQNAYTYLGANYSSYVTQAQAEAVVGELTGSTDVVCFARYDTHEPEEPYAHKGTWTWCRRVDENGRVYVWSVWWANPTEQFIKGRFFNKSIGEMIQIFALVSGRWVKVENSTITMIARGEGVNDLSMPAASSAVEYDQQKKQVTPPRVDVPVWFGGSDEGLSGGWTPSRVTALDWWYNNGFSGIETETEATYLTDELPAGLQLLSKDASLGTVLGLDRSLSGKLTKARIVAEGE